MVHELVELKSEKSTMGEEYVHKAKEAEMMKPHFVFIHGVSHGAWCWYKIKCLLENLGYKVTCIDLKSAGIDQTDPNTILHFQDYTKPLLDFMSALPDDQQVILVGHSAGGLSVTDATYRFPKKVMVAIYLAATMLKSGFCTEQDTKDGSPDISEYGEFEELYETEYSLGSQQPPTSVVVKKSFQRKLMYHMSPQEDSSLASLLLRPGPIQALMCAKFEEGDDIYKDDEIDKVPRIYIKTMNDRIFGQEQQDTMIKRWPPLNVYAMETDHSPFFSAPFALVGYLIKAAVSTINGSV